MNGQLGGGTVEARFGSDLMGASLNLEVDARGARGRLGGAITGRAVDLQRVEGGFSGSIGAAAVQLETDVSADLAALVAAVAEHVG
ncbi:hypothetical protein Mgrana_01457 [Meiothermus granaticius NBRC 107808]|uniref:Uncharacterized protein n=1 Tax=Meiothermus granaticius NBRC 107808 TaxID=1227551 RepID=A0A399F971_9DEIN|nr:hypothetical protein Mgrana_01457 [Meiothermus granaticius NBRC 107808]